VYSGHMHLYECMHNVNARTAKCVHAKVHITLHTSSHRIALTGCTPNTSTHDAYHVPLKYTCICICKNIHIGSHHLARADRLLAHTHTRIMRATSCIAGTTKYCNSLSIHPRVLVCIVHSSTCDSSCAQDMRHATLYALMRGVVILFYLHLCLYTSSTYYRCIHARLQPLTHTMAHTRVHIAHPRARSAPQLQP
jgi:hypothetical protein